MSRSAQSSPVFVMDHYAGNIAMSGPDDWQTRGLGLDHHHRRAPLGIAVFRGHEGAMTMSMCPRTA